VEVRVSDSTLTSSVRPYLDPTVPDGPTLYLNATLYRPYHRDPPCRERYYEAFEWLMKDLGGKPHWAKNFDAPHGEVQALYGPEMDRFRRVRDQADPEGMFAGPWHRNRILEAGTRLELEEVETKREKGYGGVLMHMEQS
ncbi:MAG TPA: D-arabinono-1,4-lactone oxidase, partial [Puia sp.]|nr:D-arabinono-1,4-lactone oxidase [Puia sp.]